MVSPPAWRTAKSEADRTVREADRGRFERAPRSLDFRGQKPNIPLSGNRAVVTDALNLGEALGAAEDASIERLTLYIPSRDRDGRHFASKPWIEDALRLLSAIGGGATAMPPADGAWLNPGTDRLVREKVVLVYTFIDPDRFDAQLPALRRFLHRLGRETNQGEVVCEFEGQLFKIRDYDGDDDADE